MWFEDKSLLVREPLIFTGSGEGRVKRAVLVSRSVPYSPNQVTWSQFSVKLEGCTRWSLRLPGSPKIIVCSTSKGLDRKGRSD